MKIDLVNINDSYHTPTVKVALSYKFEKQSTQSRFNPGTYLI